MPLPFTKQLSLGEIMRHLETYEKRIRCLIEGEEALKAGHLICCGVKTCSANSVTIQGLCVQTSHVRGKPHELEFIFDGSSRIKVRTTSAFELFYVAAAVTAHVRCGVRGYITTAGSARCITHFRLQGHCSCKAGNSQRCKHMIAMLLFVNRTGIQNLDLLTSTDMAQAWGKLKMTPMYEACKLQELCHVQSQPRPILDEKTKEERFRIDLDALVFCTQVWYVLRKLNKGFCHLLV
ncbi:uncharacterized protein LOC119435793 [Dermacentor silvarum]|uniref:uncharacterized protein LOC119435793 n=1 Tax=Dermacentor silvarum TaxID=543639 RepID=UPI0021019211|nr:uncharacterized protein LOC119435793 [Dermacentor silvarum]